MQVIAQFAKQLGVTMLPEQFIFIYNDYSDAENHQWAMTQEIEENEVQLQMLFMFTMKNDDFLCRGIETVLSENSKLHAFADEQKQKIDELVQQQATDRRDLEDQRNTIKELKRELQQEK